MALMETSQVANEIHIDLPPFHQDPWGRRSQAIFKNAHVIKPNLLQ